jgi:hypothetical protein
MRLTLILLVFVQISLFNCKNITSTEPDIEKAIISLTDRFPQLSNEKLNQSDYYKLTRSVKNGDRNFEIQLRSAPDSIKDEQQIIVLINQLGKCYAIPFLSNTYRDYWNFEFDNLISTIKQTNTTFDKELKTALNVLILNDDRGTSGVVIHEMLFSVLHCKKVTENDSTDLAVLYMEDNNDLPDEKYENCHERLEKNYKALSSEWHPYVSMSYYNAYWDEKNHRVYQLSGMRKIEELHVKVYRQDCVFHPIVL